MRSELETPHRGNIPGATGGGSAGGEFNSPGREAQFGIDGMRKDHPQPDGTGWKTGYGVSNGQVHPGKKDYHDDINVEDMTRERGVGKQEAPARAE